MESVQIGIIGGSGLYDMADVTDRRDVTLKTPFGDPSGPYVLGTLRGRRVAFLARHGAGHRLLPSELNYRANIFGFKTLGVERIISASAVRRLKQEDLPGAGARRRRCGPGRRSERPSRRHVRLHGRPAVFDAGRIEALSIVGHGR